MSVYAANCSRTSSCVKSMVVLLVACVMIYFPAMFCFASQLAEEIEAVETDAKEAQSIPGKVIPAKADSRLLPVPIPISNPTFGTGLAITLIYLHPKREGGMNGPTATSGVAGMYTSTDSWAVGGFHEGYYRGDQVRFRAEAGYGEFNLDFYGIGNDSLFKDNPLSFKAEGTTFTPRLLFRLPGTKWYLGGRYSYLGVDNIFDLSSLVPDLPDFRVHTQTSGLGLVGVYDTRDNNLWPFKGTWFEGIASAYGEYLDGDFNYRKMILKFVQYFPLSHALTFVYRLDGQFIDGLAPFYELSQIRLRGYSGLRFLDYHAVSAQAELRWNVHRKWWVLGFAGGGRIAEGIGDLPSAPTNYAAGGGIRYMIDEKRKLSVGFDFAYADGGASVYIQIGDWLAN